MTSPAGYRRLGGGVPDMAARLWAAMRLRRDAWTVGDVVAASGASPRYARRYVAALRAAGMIDVVEEATCAGGHGMRAASYCLTSQAQRQALPPQLVGQDGDCAVRTRYSDMSGADLAAARHALGMTVRSLAEMIGYRDSRTVRRLEKGDQPIPHEVAAKVRTALRSMSPGR